MRRLLCLLSLLFGLAFGAAPIAAGEAFVVDFGDPRIVARAELAIVESALPPPPGADWKPVSLPDSWRAPERYRQGVNGWYRFRLVGPAPTEAQSMYLWRFSMNAGVWFNGEWLGDGGSFEEPIARNWNRPLIVGLPAAMWRSGENEVMVRLRVYPGFGHLLPVAIGPTRLLQPDHERRSLAQITANQVAAATMLLATLVGLALWSLDRRDTTYLWFAGACAMLVVYSANKFVQDIPVSARAWWWLVHASVDMSYLFLLGFVHGALGVRRPRLEGSLALVLLCVLGLYAEWDLPQLARFNPVTHAVVALAGVYLVAWLVLRMRRQPSPETGLFTAMVFLLVAAGAYDQLLNSLLLPALWRTGFYTLSLAAPVLLLGLLFQLALRSLRSAQSLRIANETLEGRVRAASDEIAATYARERRLLAERSAGQERERIYRDLHDNLGARLLSLVYGARDERQQSLARDALAEMRTIVAASQVGPAALADLAEEWRLEAELRCENAGHQLGWVREGDARMSGRQRYQLERIVRELISNALEHGAGHRVEVAWRVGAAELELRVQDDGRGMPADVAPPGVLARAADLQGQARWHASRLGGTACTVSLPLAANDAAASA